MAMSCEAMMMPADSGAVSPDTIAEINAPYFIRMKKREERWLKLIPNLFTLQYAGGIGMFSAGPGWDYGKSDQWETHLLVGYLPKRYRWNDYFTVTLKEVYVPWRVRLNEYIAIKPFYATILVNSILHSDFWTSEPERYPRGYYGFSSRVRFHIGLGQRISIYIPRRKRILGKELSAYYEISICDLHVRQKFLNRAIPFKDIIAVGIGVIYKI